MTDHRTRTLLVVAAEFPPVRTIGRLRTIKFIEHLRAHGWRAIVLTIAPNGTTATIDPALWDEVPADTPIHRIALTDIEATVARVVKWVLRRPASAAVTAAPEPAPFSFSTGQALGRSPTVLERLNRLLRIALRDYVHIPDPYIFWAHGATRAGLKICSEQRIDAIYTTLPPFSAALVGKRLKQHTGLPWVVDYRDLWTGDVLREWVPPRRRRFESWLERRWIAAADAIVTVSTGKTEYLRRFHGGTGQSGTSARWATITNGYDPEEFADIVPKPRVGGETVSFVFTGRLFKNRRGYAFAEALGSLRAERPDLAARAQVYFYGGITPEIRSGYDGILARQGLGSQFHFMGDVPHAQAKTAQVEADYLLLIVDTGETSDGVIPGKLFEYVAAGRPIFALTDPGDTADIIRRARIGTVVAVNDVESCKAALANVLAAPVPELPNADRDYLDRFDRRALTGALASLLDQIVDTRPARGALGFPGVQGLSDGRNRTQ